MLKCYQKDIILDLTKLEIAIKNVLKKISSTAPSNYSILRLCFSFLIITTPPNDRFQVNFQPPIYKTPLISRKGGVDRQWQYLLIFVILNLHTLWCLKTSTPLIDFWKSLPPPPDRIRTPSALIHLGNFQLQQL